MPRLYIFGIRYTFFSPEILNKRFLNQRLASVDQNQYFMDRLLKQYDKESVKTTMLNQEEIFKEQVHELHHLYVVQKTLMIEFKMNKSRGHSKDNHQPRVWATRIVFETNNCSFTNTNNFGNIFYQLFSVRTKPINLPEHSGTSLSRDNVKMHKDFDLESPAEKFSRDIGRDQICSSSTTSSKGKMKVKSLNEQHLYTEGEAEKKKQKNCQSISSIYLHTNHKHNRQMDSSLSIKDLGVEDSTIGNINATFSQETLQKPPWYF
ncbi:hypothetical protein MKX01_027422 [Papaver californicum]|nr:hypothetical protein MKX01_015548 [Papaver californicum]KAI3971723.1 hypothetical protein MKX01_027422 [Papaver californicum]